MCINYIDFCQYNAATWPIVGPSRSSPCSRVSPAVTPRWESRSCCISALVSVKYRTNSARVISPNPRSRASSCAENTSRVATYHHHHLPADDRRHDSLLPPERIPSQTCQQIVVFSLETTGWPSRSRRTTSPSSVATTFPTQASPCTTHQGRPAGKCAHRSRSSARCSRSQSRSLGDTVLAASILASRRTNGSNGPGSKDVGGARSMKLAQDGGHLGGCPVAIRG